VFISLHVKELSQMRGNIGGRNPTSSKEGTVAYSIKADHVDRKVPSKYYEEVQ
jgi:hypothetical protein